MEQHITPQFINPKHLTEMSDERLEEALVIWQHTLEHFQGCVVSTAMDLGCLQHEQARRRQLRATLEDPEQYSQEKPETPCILSFDRPSQKQRKLTYHVATAISQSIEKNP